MIRRPPEDNMQLLNTFVKSAQYLVGLSSRQDLWDHLAKLAITYFGAEWAALIGPDAAGKLCVEHHLGPGNVQPDSLLSPQIQSAVKDVLDSGFLTSLVVPLPEPSMTALLPVTGERRGVRVFLVGHAGTDPLPNEVLNIYLALAGLAGTMLERLDIQAELDAHRTHLEELVEARTAELAAAKRHNELVLQSIGEGILGVDLNGRITFANPAAGKLTGWDAAELIGRSAHDTLHHTKADGTPWPTRECIIHATLRDGQPRAASDGSFFGRDGGPFPVEYRTGPIIENGRLVGAVLVFRDVTAQRRAQLERDRSADALRRAADELARSNTELEQFGYVVSHDLQEPLRMVRGFLQLLAEQLGGKLDQASQEYIRFAVDGAARMSQLINDLLEYSRIQTRERNPVPIDMNTVFEHATANCRKSIEDAAARVTCGDLPTVLGDHTQLTQLLQNLIGNAIKFGRAGVPGEVHVDACVDKEWWLFTVSDNGIGIPEDQLQRVFQIFKRLHTRDKYPGTGIGLAVCKKIVERHGGRIWAESQPDKGSRFCFTLPKATGALDPAGVEASAK